MPGRVLHYGRMLAGVAAVWICAASLVSAQMAAGAPSAAKARKLLDASVQALGGARWATLRTCRIDGREGAFFHGQPTGSVVNVVVLTATPDKQRVEIGPKGRVVQMYVGVQGWEITYQGAKPLPARRVAEHLRWRDHSLREVLGEWPADSRTILVDAGQKTISTHLADEVTLISYANQAATLDLDAATHLPLRLSFRWRDPEFHDRNLDAVEYDNYHLAGGIETAFTVTKFHNGETVSQLFVERAAYDIPLAPSLFDVAATAARLK